MIPNTLRFINMITRKSKTVTWYPLLCHSLILDKEPRFVQFRYNWANDNPFNTFPNGN